MRTTVPVVQVPSNLLDAIREFPGQRIVDHCGRQWTVSPFDLYATCPHCQTRMKLRAYSAQTELEDLFDAVFEWVNQEGGEELMKKRREELAEDE